MDILEAVSTRRSIRGYRPDPVPKKIIKDILGKAVFAPSAVNAQPWEFTVVSGEVLDNIRRENVEKFVSGAAQRFSANYRGIYRQRQVDTAVQIYKSMGIARNDRAGRVKWGKRGFRFFDAPAAIIVSRDKEMDRDRAFFDLGAVCQSICLIALNYGLGTCIEIQGVNFPETIRKYTGMPGSKEIIAGIAIGYPDADFPANNFPRNREPAENITSWCGFDD